MNLTHYIVALCLFSPASASAPQNCSPLSFAYDTADACEEHVAPEKHMERTDPNGQWAIRIGCVPIGTPWR